MSEDRVPFADLSRGDLVLERVYAGGTQGNASDDPLGRLLPVGNQGGFRYNGSVTKRTVKLVALYTSGIEVDWPDSIDPTTGDFTYYGDNRKPGRELHDTPRRGNQLLQDIFAVSRANVEDRREVPPIFLFQRGAHGRDIVFRGLLAPGSPRLTSDDELVAIWRTTREMRFQNYRAHFTVLDTPRVTRFWIDEVLGGDALGPSCPRAWRNWVKGRVYQALEAPRTVSVRSKAEQLPRPEGMALLRAVHEHFAWDPVKFENFAASVWVNSDPNVESVEVTRPSRDGGRDAIGEYRLGPRQDPVRLQFALEAKCYDPDGGGVGVRMVSRLISRLKHREFGVFVTTSFISKQAYAEVREDGHPIVFLTGREVVEFLKRIGITDSRGVREYLAIEHPVGQVGVIDISHTQTIVDLPPNETMHTVTAEGSAEIRTTGT